MPEYPDRVEERFCEDIPEWAVKRWGGGDDGSWDEKGKPGIPGFFLLLHTTFSKRALSK